MNGTEATGWWTRESTANQNNLIDYYWASGDDPTQVKAESESQGTCGATKNFLSREQAITAEE